MKITTITDLYNRQKQNWKNNNEYYFGITPLDSWENKEHIERHLNECAEKFWNNGTNKMKELLETDKCNDIDKLIPGSYELVYDPSGMICLYASFEYSESKVDGSKETKVKRAPLVYFPVPDDLCWYLGQSRYVLRITATVNYSLIYRIKNICYYQKAWTYDIDKDEFTVNIEDFDPYEKLTDLNREWLSNWVKCKPEELDREKFIEAMKLLPEYDPSSIYYFRFTHVDEVFNLVKWSKRFANPLKKVAIPINIAKMLTAQRVRSDAVDRHGSNNLVLAPSNLFALENSRTVIYKNDFNNSFMFTDGENFFDAFKTSTNKSAGKSRLLLDTVEVKDEKLWNVIDGKLYNMWELAARPELKVDKNLSVLSRSNFSVNNAPKRIMMTAKLRAQAVKTEGEADPFTHETPARVVFGDWEGFNFGDSLIISRSFARKLCSEKKKRIHINKISTYRYLKDKYQVGDKMSVRDLMQVVNNSSMYSNYRDIEILSLSEEWLDIRAKIPFSVGDKLTNLHGSKGIVSLILEDDQMPYLINDIGDFPAGPFDIIISALSVYRRKSFGQLFEAWASATGHTDVDNILEAVDKYYDEMKEFSEKSLVYFNGEVTRKPIGINMILRLDHDACGKQTLSYIKSNYGRLLKFGEMELLNLASRGLFKIMNELDIRSITKHHNALGQIQEMQKTGKMRYEPANSLRFFNILKTIGFDFNLNSHIDDDIDSSLTMLQKTLTDNQIDLF